MNYQALLAAQPDSPPTRAGLIGVGQFGLTLLAQSRNIGMLDLAVLCDQDVERVRAAFFRLGWSDDDVVVTDEQTRALAALEQGKRVITPDHQVVTGLPLDVLVEATGSAETGARTATDAIANGQHLVLVTKETDAIIGPLLAREAKAAGLVLSQVDGDQPSLTLALISWARTLGLEIASAGKASEYDFVLDTDRHLVTAERREMAVQDPAALWTPEGVPLAEVVRRRGAACSDIPTRTPPDFCEMCLIANGSGLKPDIPSMHAPIARAIELPDLLRAGEGGLLSGEGGRLDVFNCFRRPDEISFAGGVFVVVANPDAATGELFRQKGIPISTDGRHALVYNPTHLLGVEAAMSVLVAHRLGMSTGSDDIRAVADVAARATVDMRARDTIPPFGFRKRIEGTEPALIDAAPLRDNGPVPYFALAGLELRQDVTAGKLITAADVHLPKESLLMERRRKQDNIFFPEAAQ